MPRALTSESLEHRIGDFGVSRWPWLIWGAIITLATAALVCAVIPIGPDWPTPVASVAVLTGGAWALGVRMGGRPYVFGMLALGCGLIALVSDQDVLRTGAAVCTSAVVAVLAVVITVPAASLLAAARETVIALVCAAVGALATIGFEPAIQTERFEYVGLALAFVAAVVLVYRLGAGLHGLGRRGMIIVGVGALMMAGSLLYAEMLRRYGSTGLVDELREMVHWSRETIGAFPRLVIACLGVPALAYGSHMRARRRQGWWVCAFGVAATSPAATALANPAITLQEAALSVVYAMVIGLVIGWFLIRLDLALTGTRGRRSRSAEQAAAVRPEPSRFAPLL